MECEFHQYLELFRRKLNLNALDLNPPSSNVDKDVAKVDEAGQDCFLKRAGNEFCRICYFCRLGR